MKVSPESRAKNVFNPLHFALATWTYPATNRLLLEAAGSRQMLREHAEPMDNVGANDIAITDTGMNISYGRNTSLSWAGGQGRKFSQMWSSRLAASYVTGSHTFKGGFTYRRFDQDLAGTTTNTLGIPGAISYTFRNQAPSAVAIWAIPFNVVEDVTNVAAYVQDQWVVKQLTLSLGLRYESVRGHVPPNSLPAGIFIPARSFPAVDNVPDFKSLNPRLGVTYDLFGDGKTALKASLGRYVPYTQLTSNNPASNQAASTSRNWNDRTFAAGDPRRDNFAPDCDLTNPAPNGECAGWNDLSFGRLRAGTRWADDALTGFNRQFNNWQTSVSVQHQLRPGMALNVGYFRTWYDNFLVTDNAALTAADFDTFCVTRPTTPSRGGVQVPGAGQPLCGFYDIKPESFLKVTDNVRTLASNIGNRSEVYNGVDVTVTARFGKKGGQFSGGVSVGRTVLDACEIVAKVPEALFSVDGTTVGSGAYVGPGSLGAGTSGAWSPVQNCKFTPPWSAGTQAKFLFVYPLPLDLQVSAIYQNIAGIPIGATYSAPNAQIRDSLGRDLGSCRGAATCNGTVNVQLVSPGAAYEDRLQQVDLRFSRRFELGRFKVRANADVANIFNAGNVYSTNTGLGPQWLVPFEIMGGRLVRLTGQLDF